MLLGAIPFVPTSYFAYAKQNKLSIADDNSRKHAIAYDGPSAFAINEKRNGMVAGRDLLSKFAELFAVKSGQATCNDFQAATRGQFATRAEAGRAWAAYKEANEIVTGTTRSMAARSKYLRSLADNPNTASWMKPWLREGRVPPGYEVDHIIPLSIGGPDTPANMRLQGVDIHTIHHSKGRYRPWE